MKLKLKRATRTPHSEQILIYDFDNLGEDEKPVQIGQLDAHYVDDQIVGTLLISQEFAEGYRKLQGEWSQGQTALDDLVTEILSELSEPVGVSGTYAFEVYYPSFAGHGLFSNYPDDEEADFETEQETAPGHIPPPPSPYAPPQDDDFSRRLRER